MLLTELLKALFFVSVGFAVEAFSVTDAELDVGSVEAVLSVTSFLLSQPVKNSTQTIVNISTLAIVFFMSIFLSFCFLLQFLRKICFETPKTTTGLLYMKRIFSIKIE